GKTYLKFAARHNTATWTDMVTMSSDGFMGIGTTAPGYLLHVATTGATPFLIERTSGQFNGLKIFFTSNPAAGIGVGAGSTIFQNQASSSDMLFMPTQTSGAMVIKSSSKVGIGTVSPSYKFHVSDDAGFMVNNPQYSNGPYIEPDYAASYHELLNTTKEGFHASVYGYNLNDGPSTSSQWGLSAVNGIGVFGKSVRTRNPAGFTFCIGVYGKAQGASFNVGGVFYGDSPATIGDRSATPSSEGAEAKDGYGVWAASTYGTAGFFNGSQYATANYLPADSKLKTATEPIQKASEKISLLKPSYFSYKDDLKSMNLPSGKQMGLNAQDLEKDFPELVTEMTDISGYLESNKGESIKTFKAVNYTNLIPLLIAGVQEQQEQLKQQAKDNEDLKNLVALQQQQINELTAKASGVSGINEFSGQNDGFRMDQNIPNPFGTETVINYNLPKNCNKAIMNVYDLSGKQISSFPLSNQSTSYTIAADKLAAGIYIYSIVIDGKIMDSKRMVVSEK
ncbi:MAG: T9SS type A sorting domain-containing protein, partial [Bacteroidia bacterium]|nr:T9SS type A sorting domain-containing protein [Bacteroidia bacterium]